MERSEHRPQTGKQPTALLALGDVALHAAAFPGAQIGIEVVGHVLGRPAMV
jgi:hypothetical protein